MITSFADLLGLSVGFGIILVALLAFILIFEIWMFVNVILNKNISDTRKILWVIGMLLLHPFVAIGYYFTDYQKSI